MPVMLVEDDLELGLALTSVLQYDGFQVEWFRRGVDADLQLDDRFEMVLLDIRLPDGCGLELLRRWRGRGLGIPVIIITAKTDLQSRLTGLNDGADDYLVKPFEPTEMVARLRAVLRRLARQAHSVWRVGDLEINSCTHAVAVQGEPVNLSPTEFELLLVLAQAAGTVVSKSRLLQVLAPWGATPGPGSIDFHIFNLRKKLGSHRIQTVRGIGHVLCAEASQDHASRSAGESLSV